MSGQRSSGALNGSGRYKGQVFTTTVSISPSHNSAPKLIFSPGLTFGVKGETLRVYGSVGADTCTPTRVHRATKVAPSLLSLLGYSR
ncbi:hypothetical protein E2C01_032447 [Portunus trituberculatus]|uniref:Uncharacterized protein n=1 Tax=Portunus trituberculatus TaxID=210409 RepID=A0A5B7F126_PORTR|nr:hypothetical protein [Portunus trituberculatus]